MDRRSTPVRKPPLMLYAPAVYTIGRLGELFGLSRSTLLYYSSIGLLVPLSRTEAGYRLYSEEDRARLEKILLFRGLGVPLAEIGGHLDAPESGPVSLLLKRMIALNREIERLKEQQRAILDMIEDDGSLANIRPRMRLFESFGKSVGMERASYAEVHRAFERSAPALHRRFLRFLGFSEAEIRSLIRKVNRGSGSGSRKAPARPAFSGPAAGSTMPPEAPHGRGKKSSSS